MTNDKSISRKPLHRRTVTCEAFELDDDLIEIEGTLLYVTRHHDQPRASRVHR
jgi:hypothetical protein